MRPSLGQSVIIRSFIFWTGGKKKPKPTEETAGLTWYEAGQWPTGLQTTRQAKGIAPGAM
jgi:hypothetical protein